MRVQWATSFLNIGFTSDGKLDEAAILAFSASVGSSIIAVDTWYDQSGNGRNLERKTSNGLRILVDGNFIKRDGVPQVVCTGDEALKWTPNAYANNINIFYIPNLPSTELALRSMISSSSMTPAQSHGLVSTSGSSNTTYHRNAGPPQVYKNKILQSISNRGHVYTLWTTPSVVCEKNVNISSLWSPNDIVMGGATGGSGTGHKWSDWVEFWEDMSTPKLEGISDAINNSFSTPLY